MVHKTQKFFTLFAPIVIFSLGIFATLYITLQQNYRMSANDPQIAIAQDIADEIVNGKTPVLPNPVDMRSSLSPFVIIYDTNWKIVSSSALLDGVTPNLPQGVLVASEEKGDNRITWQPTSGVRIAAVVKLIEGQKGFVLVGRSLKEVEIREDNLLHMVAIGWIVTIVTSGFAMFLFI